MKHIVLLGDSIFDNAPYVDQGGSVLEQLQQIVSDECKVTLLAVDGDVTNDVASQLDELPSDATHLFVSCGGNDALQSATVLHEQVSTVAESLNKLNSVRQSFRSDYQQILNRLIAIQKDFTICTIYNTVPNIETSELTALALFNEVILEEGIKSNIAIIDLRVVFNKAEDYSQLSPIEPSAIGAKKIAEIIWGIVSENNKGECNVYS